MPETQKEYVFFLNDTEVEEPVGWDAVTFTLRRSDLYSGMEFSFSDILQFTGSAAKILQAAYEMNGFDAVANFRLESCEDVLYSGVINFSIYKETSSCDDCVESITVGIQQSGLTQRFKNRMEIPVNLFKETGLDGNTLTPIPSVDLQLHSKEIVFKSDYKINTNLNPFASQTFAPGPGPFLVVPPLQTVTEEIEQTFQPSGPDYPDNPLFYSGFSYPTGVTTRTIKTQGRLKFKYLAGFAGLDNTILLIASIEVRSREFPGQQYQSELLLPPTDFNGLGAEVDFSWDLTLQLPPDSNVHLAFQVAGAPLFSFIFDETVSKISFTENSVFPASSTKSMLVHEAFSRICESITGQTDCFRSNYFGGINSLPHSYEADGCGRYIALTNGLNIRQLKDKDGNLMPITSSFKALFDAQNANNPLGMRIEKEDGIERIRVEPISYFYQDLVSYNFKHVKEIEKSIAVDLYYNEAEFGYQKWETETKSGLDEFNSYRSYALPIVQAKRKLSAISNFVTGGYAIETTRRLQFRTDPNTDSTYDNENFLIAAINDEGVIRAERNESFTTVAGVQSPETAYNLRFSPARMLLNWYPILAASMVKKTNPIITFQSGKGNYSLLTERTDVCDQAMDAVLESQNVSAADVKLELRKPYYLPEIYTFEFPISLKVFLQLRTKAIMAIRFGCNETNKGFLKEVTYQPNDGIAKFKIVRAYED